jgi:RNA polymerase sigma-70 factor, ECF subfamily
VSRVPSGTARPVFREKQAGERNDESGRLGVLNGPGTAVSGPAELAERFESEAMPFLDQLYAAAMQMTRDRAAAEDLVQQTYVRAFDTFGSFTRRTSLKAWLFRILAGTLRERGGWQHPPHLSASMECPSLRSPEGGSRAAFAMSRTPVAQALDGLPEHTVRAALQQLPREAALVVHLADVEDFSHREMAEILDIPVSTATSRLCEGRQHLLQAIIGTARQQELLG